MKVLLLAAGRSKRVKPIEDKNFLRFAGKTLIEHQLDMLNRVGLKDIILVAGAHNIEQLKSVAEEYETKLVEQEDLEDGMAGAILSSESAIMAEHTEGKSEPLLVMSSNDVVTQSALESLIKAKEASDSDAYLLAYKVNEYFPGGYLEVENNRIKSIVEKPGEGNEPSDLVNLVFHIFRRPNEIINRLKETESEKDDRYEVALDSLMKEWNFEAVSYDGYWQAIKYPWHILDLMNFVFEMMLDSKEPNVPRISDRAEVADTAVIRGNVIIADGVKVFDHATIVGPAYIGKNSVVANNALVRSSMTGENCVIGYSTELARSFIGDDCWFHSNYIGDSVMGDNVSFGAGAICANLRLDEKEILSSGRNKLGPILGSNIRIGVNTSLMPGVKIGSNSMITSGLTISQDIEPGKYVSGKTELSIRENKAYLDPSAREKMLGNL